MGRKGLKYYLDKKILVQRQHLILGDEVNSIEINPELKVKIYTQVKEIIHKTVGIDSYNLQSQIQLFFENTENKEHRLKYLGELEYDLVKKYSEFEYGGFYNECRNKKSDWGNNAFYQLMTEMLTEVLEYVENFIETNQVSFDDFPEWVEWLEMEKVFQMKECVKNAMSQFEEVALINPYPNVFKRREAFEIFLEIVGNFNVINRESKMKPKRGFQACMNAISKNYVLKEKIFIPRLKESDYIAFLNKQFNAEIKRKEKLSKPDSYEYEVRNVVDDIRW